MVKKSKETKKITPEEIDHIISLVNDLYPKASRDINGEWDKKSNQTVFWDHTQVFASIDPKTGKNREAYIKVTEGLHDGYLEIILVTPANTLNFKVRPELGQLEAYHDNYTAVNGETHQNFHSKAYVGFDDLAKEQAKDEEDCNYGEESEIEDWLKEDEDNSLNKIFEEFEKDWENVDLDSILDDNIFYSEENVDGLWEDKECEAFLKFLMEPEPQTEEEKTSGNCSNCSNCTCGNTAPLLWEKGAIIVGSKIRLITWPKNEVIIIQDIIDEGGWDYKIIFRNQNGVVQAGVLFKQKLHLWERG